VEEQRDRRIAQAMKVLFRQRQSLTELLEQTRQDHHDCLLRLRSVEASLRETRQRIAALDAAGQADASVDAEAQREREQILRQEQTGYAEQLLALTATARKLQLIIRQSQRDLDYLLGESEEPPQDERSTEGPHLRALDVQEEERQRLAREIHDGPVQVLVNAIFVLSSCQLLFEKDPPKAKAELVRLESDLREGLAEVRHFIFDLRPTPLADLGLPATIRKYGEAYRQRFGGTVELDVPEEIQRLNLAREAAIFRIVQEALQNIRKHSGATSVRVSLQVEGDDLVVRVADNGRGFDPDNAAGVASRHFGLQSMRERAEFVHGSLDVRSRPGEGTVVVLRVPLISRGEL
jgi:two-component system, NarL family, sensor histidine kinase DegS